MKHLYIALALLLPTAHVAAQPIINNYLDYKMGDTIKRVDCSPGVQAGGSGANITWVFNNLTAIDTATTAVVAPWGTPGETDFQNATHVLLTDGTYTYMRRTNTANLLLGSVNPTMGTPVKHPDPVQNAQRPFTYNSYFKDTFTIESTTSTGGGHGTIELTGDAYGSLQLPTRTYNNVLRIKMNLKQVDTMIIGGTPMPYQVTATTYYWVNDSNASELLRIDTTTISGAFNQTNVSVSYLLDKKSPVGIADKYLAPAQFSASLKDEHLLVKGDFKRGKQYEIILYNLNGVTLSRQIIVPQQNDHQLPLDKYILTGTYLLSIREVNSNLMTTILKLLKN